MNPSKEDAIARMSTIAHISSDSLTACLMMIEHLKRNLYTAEEIQDYLISNDNIEDPTTTAG